MRGSETVCLDLLRTKRQRSGYAWWNCQKRGFQIYFRVMGWVKGEDSEIHYDRGRVKTARYLWHTFLWTCWIRIVSVWGMKILWYNIERENDNGSNQHPGDAPSFIFQLPASPLLLSQCSAGPAPTAASPTTGPLLHHTLVQPAHPT